MGVALWSLSMATAIDLLGCYDRYLSQRTNSSSDSMADSNPTLNATGAAHNSAPLAQIGCPKAADWSIANTELMDAGWRIFEVEFFEDIACTQTLMPIKIEGSMPMECETKWELGSAFDKKKSTLWVSACGIQSQCGFADTTIGRAETLRPIPDPCAPLEAYLIVSFDEPVSVNCVRILQASPPFKSKKITITAHLGQDCYRCADGSMDVSTLFTTPETNHTNSINSTNSTNTNSTNTNSTNTNSTSTNSTSTNTSSEGAVETSKICSQVKNADPFPCYDTLVGTPGLLARFYNDSDLLRDFSNGTVYWNRYPSSFLEHMSQSLNYQIVSSPMISILMNNTFAVHWTGFLRIPLNGKYIFSILSAGHARLFIGTDLVIDNPSRHTRGGTHSQDAEYYFRQGDMVEISVEYLPLYNANIAGIMLTWTLPKPFDQWKVITQQYLLQRIMQETDQKKVEYVAYPNVHCHADRMGNMLPTYSSARAKCDLDDTCGAVYGKNCENGVPTSSITLCKIGFEPESSEEFSCILVKEYITDDVATVSRKPEPDHASSLVLLWLLLLA